MTLALEWNISVLGSFLQILILSEEEEGHSVQSLHLPGCPCLRQMVGMRPRALPQDFP